MAAKRRQSARSALEKAAKARASAKYVLRLYVAGINPRSRAAIQTISEICQQRLEGRYDLKVIDIYQNPVLAKGEEIIAAPTLIKKLPLPLRRLIGNLSDTDRILVGLDLQPRE